MGYTKRMGFFNAIKNIALGKPVFTNPPAPNGQQPMPASGVPPAAPAQTGPKVLPPAYIERIEVREQGNDDMQVNVIVQNYSREELLLDKIELFGKTLYLNGKQLSPGEEDEETVYEGDRPRSTSNGPCTLYYKNNAGDYFASVHNIEYEAQLPDGTYKPRYIKWQSPIRDI